MQGRNAYRISATVQWEPERGLAVCTGSWAVHGLKMLAETGEGILPREPTHIQFDCKHIDQFDTAGALTLWRWMQDAERKGHRVSLALPKPEWQALMDLVTAHAEEAPKRKVVRDISLWETIGRAVYVRTQTAQALFTFLGLVSVKLVAMWQHIHRWAWKSGLRVIEDAGYHALSLIALLSFLVGLVIAYQMSIQLSTYGANIYIVDLTGLIMLREFGPFLTAIIVAARTSTAFTAQIGTMKVNEEIDALETMGASPIERLVLPKVFALLIALPLLSVWSEVFGVGGGMLLANWDLHISYGVFLQRFQQVIELKQLILGLIKVPFFAVIISLVGCFQGFAVASNADSVGYRTTQSAVQSIFLIIITDAFFSIVYSWYGE